MTDVVCASEHDCAQPFVKILSIGGTGVFGMNCLLMVTPGQRILVDCGVLFPADDDLGVDLITPDFSVLEALIVRQNYVPVVDDKGIFIGIITRKSVMKEII